MLARIWKGYAVFRCIQIQMQNILRSRKIFSKSACQKRHKIQAKLNYKSGARALSGSLIRCVDCKSRRGRFPRSRNDTHSRDARRGGVCIAVLRVLEKEKAPRTVALYSRGSWFADDLTWGR